MIRKRTAITCFFGLGVLVGLTLGAIRGGVSQVSAAQSAGQLRMLRILTGQSEPARMNLIGRLRTQPNQLHANLDVVAQATTQLLQQHRGDEDIASPSDGNTNHQTLSKNHRPPVPDSLAQLIALLGRSPREEDTAILITALDHPDERVAMITMDTIGEFKIKAAVDDLATQIKRPEFEQQYAFRFTLVRAIAQLHCVRSIDLLQKLHHQLDGQLRYEIAMRLENVDLRDFAGDRAELAAYRQLHPPESFIRQVSFEAEPSARVTHAESGRLRLVDSPSESTGRLKLSAGHYYGIELRAGRMLFVIDRSGSMKEPARYATRLQSAKRELIRVIEGLRPENEFSIMLFDTYVQSWRDELVPATEQNKRAAIAFAERITLGDKTNTHAVLNEAIEFDDQLEAVFMLTDGQPTTGNMIQPVAIVRDLVNRNRVRHLKFHTIGFGVNTVTSEFLKSLAEQTGGEFREVE